MIIDRIFIINLKERIDRKNHMVKELNKQNMDNYEFFEAIKPTEKEVLEWNKVYCNHVSKINYKIGCLGCLKSHIAIIKLALERGYENILILEDDTVFSQPFDTIYEVANELEFIGETYDMLYLAGSHLGSKRMVTDNVMKIVGTYTTGSYLINKKTMNYVINNINHYSREIDVFYAEEIQTRFDCYCANPRITKQMSGYSDIQQKNVKYAL
jgi:glycosyl transferase, family 25